MFADISLHVPVLDEDESSYGRAEGKLPLLKARSLQSEVNVPLPFSCFPV